MGQERLTDGDQELTDGGPRVDRWGPGLEVINLEFILKTQNKAQ